jgi:L-fucose dehydrogenase
MDLGLQNRVVLVTGGASGIGQAITRACLREGAMVFVVGRISTGVEEFIEEMRSSHQTCEFHMAELADPNACHSAIEAVRKQYGRLDALVNNAGINDKVGLADGDPQRFERSLALNLHHYYALAHYGLPLLGTQRGSSIVNIASKVAVTGQGHTSGYAAAKGAVLALTREWAAELLPLGIRVNAVLPAEVMTPNYQAWLQTFKDPKTRLEHIEQQIPLGHRMTTPAEIAAAVVFLLSPTQSAHTTGQILHVDGGYVHLDRLLTAQPLQ